MKLNGRGGCLFIEMMLKMKEGFFFERRGRERGLE